MRIGRLYGIMLAMGGSFNPLDHPIVFARPKRLMTSSTWKQHIPLAMFVVDALKPKLLVELGTYYGLSYCAFCQAVQGIGLDCRCHAVDTWKGDPQTGFYGSEVLDDLRAHHDLLYASFSELIQSTFDQALDRFPPGTIDLLHIDGFHTYEAVQHDVESWLPKLSERGVLLLHDTNVREGDFGVWQVWDELKARYPHFEFLHGHGLGVVAIGKEQPEPLKNLFDASEEEAKKIRQFFSLLGRAWEHESEMELALAENKRLERMMELALAEDKRLERMMALAEDKRLEPMMELALAENKRLEQMILALLDAYTARTDSSQLSSNELGRFMPPYGPDAAEDVEGYRRWLERQRPLIEERRKHVADRLKAAAEVATISVVVPVYRPDLSLLRLCAKSVRSQTYPHWQLCVCDDGSNDPELSRYLEELKQADPRVRVWSNESNQGISAATNAALDLADGKFVAFLDQDDEIAPDALAEIAIATTEDPSIDLLYTDEDKINERGERFAPFFKPEWSPDYLLSHPYMGHLLAIRKSLVEDVGRLRSQFDGSQDYDLMLRATEKARTIARIPKVLYHWRTVEGSAAGDEDAKPWAHKAALDALQSALDRRGVDAIAIPGGHIPWAFRTKRRIESKPLVSVIIPFRDGADLLQRCLDSLGQKGGYDHWQAILVDNQSWEPETLALLDRLSRNPKFTIHSYPHPFNWSAINNWAVEHSEGELLLFLNNDVEGIADGWVAAMIEHAQRPEVGIVGARLLYPTGHIQHAGVIIGMGGIAGHSFRYCPPGRPAYFVMDRIIRNYSAVTGACMMVRRNVFEELDGFDEAFAVAYNDIDFCLRARQRGYLVVYTPYAEATHYEAMSRGESTDLPEIREMFRRWIELIKQGDPYYNSNLGQRRHEFCIPSEGETPPWIALLPVLESQRIEA